MYPRTRDKGLGRGVRTSDVRIQVWEVGGVYLDSRDLCDQVERGEGRKHFKNDSIVIYILHIEEKPILEG